MDKWDHFEKDACQAALSNIKLKLDRYKRRMYVESQAVINSYVEAARRGQIEVGDGIELGRRVSDGEYSSYLANREPQKAIESAEAGWDRFPEEV